QRADRSGPRPVGRPSKQRVEKNLDAARTSDSPPYGWSLAPETRVGLDRFAILGIAQQLKPITHWCSVPGHERGSGFIRSLALMAACGAYATRATSLESLVPYRNRAERSLIEEKICATEASSR